MARKLSIDKVIKYILFILLKIFFFSKFFKKSSYETIHDSNSMQGKTKNTIESVEFVTNVENDLIHQEKKNNKASVYLIEILFKYKINFNENKQIIIVGFLQVVIILITCF